MASSRSRREGRSPFAVGVMALIVVCALVYLGFTKDVPFIGKPFEVNAVFPSANSIRLNSPVRIAGVNVGKVTKVEAQNGGTGAVVTMSIKDDGLPIHEDATAKIRPRIFLEGNFFVDLKPGTPRSPALGSGDTIKINQTSTPVQLDQVLSTLQDDTRQDLRDTLDALSVALNEKPSAAQDANNDKDTRGETGAQSLNDTLLKAGPAERDTAIVNQAFLGTQPTQDIARLIKGTARTTEGLARDEDALKDLVTNFSDTMGIFASEESNLRQTIRLLAPTLENANSAFDSLNNAFPATRAFAREILPGVRETPATIAASFPWIAQARKLVSQPELRGLVANLSPATTDLARLTTALKSFLPETDLTSRCATDVILPTGDVVIKDEFSTGVENYKDFFTTLVGLAGEGQNFDGNGGYVRFEVGGGSQTVSLTPTSGSGDLVGNLSNAPLGTRPNYPGKRPPYVHDQPCYKQKLPDLNGPAAAKGGADQGPGQKQLLRSPVARKAAAADLEALRSKLRPFGSKTGLGKAASK